MTKIDEWRVFCITENKWVYGWLQDGITPTKCFTDTSHTINLESINIINNLSSNEVTIDEESIKTQGNFRIEGFKFTAPANSVYTYYLDLSYDINLLVAWVNITNDNLGDVVNSFYDIGSTGTLTAAITSPTTNISVDSTITSLFNIGYILKIKRLSDNLIQELGEVTAIDKINNILTTSLPTSENFAIGDQIIIKVNAIKNMTLNIVGKHSIGTSKIGSSHLDKQGKIYITYENKSTTDKLFTYELEYLY